ncbi:hypothetical protein RRV45_03860 [Bacillus sp. DTU_2020_1000418_1_SI_GHA_SEK_038]|uniref:hypothetical protein n=1 Tax=Bacillus sp. DTU_2020_1000418_1_SI_GHA_SEK_038 TaxID=3077585 RepID=UPI0028ED0626|nr:hypothetical protein [Bacillus sp. DTU_2020_1000418_1_SI_GHA_SEK_038]WNS76159.1 hypothetical protein RRV45_03860 [Bacillus sp. DTU_2020_1000418_1_SI_GHA_SEK_038]
MKKIFRNRIKPLVIMQLLCLIPILILCLFIFKDGNVNFFYNGIFQLIFAAFWLLTGIENIMMKKRGYSFMSVALCIIFIYLATQSFQLANIK